METKIIRRANRSGFPVDYVPVENHDVLMRRIRMLEDSLETERAKAAHLFRENRGLKTQLFKQDRIAGSRSEAVLRGHDGFETVIPRPQGEVFEMVVQRPPGAIYPTDFAYSDFPTHTKKRKFCFDGYRDEKNREVWNEV